MPLPHGIISDIHQLFAQVGTGELTQNGLGNRIKSLCNIKEFFDLTLLEPRTQTINAFCKTV